MVVETNAKVKRTKDATSTRTTKASPKAATTAKVGKPAAAAAAGERKGRSLKSLNRPVPESGGFGSGGAKSSGGGGKKEPTKRSYGAIVEKGDNQWKREWSGFMSGVRHTAEGASVKLPQCMDYEQQEESTFSYLFMSPAQKKAERDSKKKDNEKKLKEQKQEYLKKKLAAKKALGGDGAEELAELDRSKSKMQKALVDAQKRGLDLAGMNRHEKRNFLHLTVTEEQRRAEAIQKETTVQDLMDPRLQWYQQGPYPIDIIAEKLVIKKAVKHAKQQGLRYNFLTVHPSWVAARQKQRQLRQVVSYGVHFAFPTDAEDDEGADRRDVTAVPSSSAFSKKKDTQAKSKEAPAPVARRVATADEEREQQEFMTAFMASQLSGIVVETQYTDSRIALALGGRSKQKQNEKGAAGGDERPEGIVSSVPSARTPFVVGGGRAAVDGKALLRANLSTNFMSSSLVHGKADGA